MSPRFIGRFYRWTGGAFILVAVGGFVASCYGVQQGVPFSAIAGIVILSAFVGLTGSMYINLGRKWP